MKDIYIKEIASYDFLKTILELDEPLWCFWTETSFDQAKGWNIITRSALLLPKNFLQIDITYLEYPDMIFYKDPLSVNIIYEQLCEKGLTICPFNINYFDFEKFYRKLHLIEGTLPLIKGTEEFFSMLKENCRLYGDWLFLTAGGWIEGSGSLLIINSKSATVKFTKIIHSFMDNAYYCNAEERLSLSCDEYIKYYG